MRFLRTREFRLMWPYFLLALTIIIAHRVFSNVDVFFGAVQWLWQIVTPFFYGFLLAYILNIPSTGIQKFVARSASPFLRRRKRLIGILGAYALLFFLIFLLLNLIIPAIYNSITLFVANFQLYVDSVQAFITYISQREIVPEISLQELLVTEIGLDGMLALLDTFTFENWIMNTLTGVWSALFTLVIAFISSIYILVEKEKFKAFLCRMLTAFTPRNVCTPILKYARTLNQNFKQYIYTQTIDGLILGTVTTIQLQLLGSPYALLLGLMLGVFNYVPYFGSIVATIIAVLVVAFTQGVMIGAVTAVILLITQQVDANIIQPKLMSGSFSLSPLLVIICITIGGAIANVPGMIAAIPIAAVLKEILDNILDYREAKKQSAEAQANP